MPSLSITSEHFSFVHAFPLCLRVFSKDYRILESSKRALVTKPSFAFPGLLLAASKFFSVCVLHGKKEWGAESSPFFESGVCVRGPTIGVAAC